LKKGDNKKIRVLYLAPNRVYLNPNINLIPALFRSSFDVVFYGPGFNSSDELEMGIYKFYDTKGPFDLIIIDGTILFWNEVNGLIPFTTSYNYFNVTSIPKIFQEIKMFFTKENLPKILIPNIDYYIITKQDIEFIQKTNPYIISRDKAFWKSIDELEDIKNEKFGRNVNDNWYNFITNVKKKIISFPGIISETEFKYHPLDLRKNEIVVPGVTYHNRGLAIKTLNKSKYRYYSRHNKRKVLSRIISKLNSRFLVSYYNHSFNKSIEDSKVAFTCGSALGYPLRKFIEIPAMGTLMFAKPFFGYKEFGYVNEKNFIKCEPYEINEKLDFYLNASKKSQQIVNESQKFLLDKHSFSARKKQLLLVINLIKSNSFYGSQWVNGNFKLY
jgi:hypothetical protein